MKLFSNEIKEKKTKKTEMTEKIFGQSEATLNTLEVELKKALDKNNKPLICSILNTILSKGFLYIYIIYLFFL